MKKTNQQTKKGGTCIWTQMYHLLQRKLSDTKHFSFSLSVLHLNFVDDDDVTFASVQNTTGWRPHMERSHEECWWKRQIYSNTHSHSRHSPTTLSHPVLETDCHSVSAMVLATRQCLHHLVTEIRTSWRSLVLWSVPHTLFYPIRIQLFRFPLLLF